MAIERPKVRPAILKEEIAVNAKVVPDRITKEAQMVELLQTLNPQTSRAVVFVTSRRVAEDLAHHIGTETGLSAAPFHAGLSSDVRLKTYEQFRGEELSVLCATKAFGMGMDIDNIHTVIHFGPPSSLEDYIQEIGRAARKRSSLEEAGLPKATAHLLYETGDFGKMRDRLKNGFLSPIDLIELHSLLVSEWKQTGSQTDNPLSIQMGHLASRLRGGQATTNQVRIALYWLERLGRVEIGYYTPAQMEIEIDLGQSQAARRGLSREACSLLDYLQTLANKAEPDKVRFSAKDARMSLGSLSQDQLFVHLAELARCGVIRYHRRLLLPLSERRAQESRSGIQTGTWPLLNATLAAIKSIREDFELDAEHTYTRDELIQRFKDLALEHLQPEEFAWLSAPEREEQAHRERCAFPRRVPAVLRLMRGLHIVYVRPEVSSNGLIYSLTLHRKEWDLWMDALPALIGAALKDIISQGQTKEESAELEAGAADAQSLLLATQEAARPYNIPCSISHLQVILRFLRDLGYLQRSDVFIPMTLEVWVTDPGPVVLSDIGRDARTLREFEEQKRLGLLRLAALQAVPDLTGDPTKLREFVEQHYFRAASSDDLIALLEEYLPAQNDILRQLREEALVELLEGDPDQNKPGLSAQQREVYDAPLDRHLRVVAGPGAGKTHALLARLVRLVHQEDVRASDILVLAFTRAVVSELQYRLQDLLGQLGYGALARAIRVTTFHAFVLGMLREFNLLEKDFNLEDQDCFEEFEKHLRRNPDLRRCVASRYRYVLVDEFQDVHGPRYRLLEHLAAGRQTYLLVVGDDDQSIYDYERAPGEADATQYFERFEKSFDPLSFPLTTNYRSAKAIVSFSQDIVGTLPKRLKKDEALIAYRSSEGIAEWQQDDTELVTLIHEAERYLDESPDRRSQHSTIALLARTNRDVYRVKAQLERQLGNRFSLLVQGEESRFIHRRDVVKALELLEESLRDEQLTPARLLGALRENLSKNRFKHWMREQPPEQHELWYLMQEFLSGAGHEATVADFAEYVREMSKNGNYLRVVARRRTGEGEGGHILLSTIHKVKGLEFPAVIMLNSDMKVNDIVQETRTLYVGMTRAEDILVALQGERERRLLERLPFEPSDQRHHELAVAPSLADVYISKFGHKWETQRLIYEKVRRGDKITIVRYGSQRSPFSIRHDDTGEIIGLLAGIGARSGLTRDLLRRFGDCRSLVGLEVTGVYRRYAELDEKYDKEHGSSFYGSLCDRVKEHGYYYVIEIGGLVHPAGSP